MSLNARHVIKKLKNITKIKSDNELAKALGVSPNTIAMWKSRNTLNYPSIIAYCDDKEVDLNRVLSTRENSFLESTPKSTPKSTPNYVNLLNDLIKQSPEIVNIKKELSDMLKILNQVSAIVHKEDTVTKD